MRTALMVLLLVAGCGDKDDAGSDADSGLFGGPDFGDDTGGGTGGGTGGSDGGSPGGDGGGTGGSTGGSPGGGDGGGTGGTAPDDDGDGYNAYEDCDDRDPMVNPGAAEVCDGLDNDCDGEVDEGCEVPV